MQSVSPLSKFLCLQLQAQQAVVYVRGSTPVKNIFSSAPSKSFPQCIATDSCKGGGLISMAALCLKGGDYGSTYGFNVGALF
jgi:hypothetical protein